MLPFVAGANPFAGQGGFVDIATTMLIFALFASGFNLLLGHLGELSFGHAMFFRARRLRDGALRERLHDDDRSAGRRRMANNNLLDRAAALAAHSCWCGPSCSRGLIVPRSSGVYYSMITLAFAQVIYFIAFKWSDRHRRVRTAFRTFRGRRCPGFNPTGYLNDSPSLSTCSPPSSVFVCALRCLYWITRLAVRHRAARDSREQDSRALSGLRREQIPRQRVRALGDLSGDRGLAVDVLPAVDQPRCEFGRRIPGTS